MTSWVACASDYWMHVAEVRWRDGQGPAEHLWGVPELRAADVDARCVPVSPWPSTPFWRAFSRATRNAMGPVRFQRTLARHATDAAVLYCTPANAVQGLALLRRLHMWRRQIVAVVHPLPPATRSGREAIRGVTAAICISRRVRDELLAGGFDARRLTHLAWGPDLRWKGYHSTVGGDAVVSTGKSRRDIALMAAVADAVDVPVVAYDDAPSGAGSGGALLRRAGRGYDAVLRDAREALVIAIPLRADPGGRYGTAGLTELNTALALGKPVIATRNPYLDIDVEREGIGWWVEPGDRDGWVRAIREAVADPAATRERGLRGRVFAERAHNAQLYGQGLVPIIKKALARA